MVLKYSSIEGFLLIVMTYTTDELSAKFCFLRSKFGETEEIIELSIHKLSRLQLQLDRATPNSRDWLVS